MGEREGGGEGREGGREREREGGGGVDGGRERERRGIDGGREREGQTDRGNDRERERDRDIERIRETDGRRKTEIQREIERQLEIEPMRAKMRCIMGTLKDRLTEMIRIHNTLYHFIKYLFTYLFIHSLTSNSRSGLVTKMVILTCELFETSTCFQILTFHTVTMLNI